MRKRIASVDMLGVRTTRDLYGYIVSVCEKLQPASPGGEQAHGLMRLFGAAMMFLASDGKVSYLLFRVADQTCLLNTTCRTLGRFPSLQGEIGIIYIESWRVLNKFVSQLTPISDLSC